MVDPVVPIFVGTWLYLLGVGFTAFFLSVFPFQEERWKAVYIGLIWPIVLLVLPLVLIYVAGTGGRKDEPG